MTRSNFDTLHAKATDVGRRPMRLGMFLSLCAAAFLAGALVAVVW